MIMAAVVIISLFKPTDGTTGNFTVMEEGDTEKYTLLTVMWGLVGAVFLAFEILCSKWLMIKR